MENKHKKTRHKIFNNSCRRQEIAVTELHGVILVPVSQRRGIERKRLLDTLTLVDVILFEIAARRRSAVIIAGCHSVDRTAHFCHHLGEIRKRLRS